MAAKKTYTTLQLGRGRRVVSTSGTYRGHTGVVESPINHKKTDDAPDRLAHGYHVALDSGEVIMVASHQVKSASRPFVVRGNRRSIDAFRVP